MSKHFWRCKWPLSEKRLLRAKAVLDATGETKTGDAIAAMNDDQLAEFLAALMGRPVKKVRRRLTIGGAMAVLYDFGQHTDEVKKLYG